MNGHAAVLGSEWENVRTVLELLAEEGFIDDAVRESGEKNITKAEAQNTLVACFNRSNVSDHTGKRTDYCRIS